MGQSGNLGRQSQRDTDENHASDASSPSEFQPGPRARLIQGGMKLSWNGHRSRKYAIGMLPSISGDPFVHRWRVMQGPFDVILRLRPPARRYLIVLCFSAPPAPFPRQSDGGRALTAKALLTLTVRKALLVQHRREQGGRRPGAI